MRIPKPLGVALALAGLMPWASAAPARPDIVLADFESGDFGDWSAEGKSFVGGPVAPEKMYPNRQGKFLAISRLERFGDGAKGTLTSPPFRLERPYLIFLIGGGSYEGETCVELVIDGQVVISEVGRQKPALEPVFWDVSAYQGKEAQIRLVDSREGTWGHIAADQFVLSDEMREPADSTR